MSNDLTDISDQLETVMNLMADSVDDINNSGKSLSDIFLDVSDENITKTKQGKISDSRNYGKIEADRNCGGIAGSMAIEYTADPEDEISKPDTLNFTYQLKAVLQSCVNEGKITGKKASADGSVLCSYSADDYGMFQNLCHYPAAKHAKGTMRKVFDWDTNKYHGEIPEAPETYNVIGNINEWQVNLPIRLWLA
mgnify:CR=1 FL=1